MKTPHDFYTSVIGKRFDIDGAYGAQCWDGAMYYSQWLGYPVFHCGISGYAKDIWNQRSSSGILKYYDAVQRPFKDGDILVWTNCQPCPWSHIAIFRTDNGDGTFVALGQNQGGMQGAFNQRVFSYVGVMGGLRPKCYTPAPKPKAKPASKPKPLPKPVVVLKKPEPQTYQVKNNSGMVIGTYADLHTARTNCPEGTSIFDRTGIKIGDAKTTAVFRIYNPNSGEHVFTTSPEERDYLIVNGWDSEKTAWVSPLSGEAVYRLYNKNAGTHMYTGSHAEHDNLFKIGWDCEGVAFYSGTGADITRLYLKGQHLFTADPVEIKDLERIGWKNEGIAFKAA